MGRKRRGIVTMITFLAILGLVVALFMYRAPVVMVVDDEFTGLYGARRTLIKQAVTSLKLFRRVKVVRVADGASADVAAFAAAAAAARPYAALFPARYQDGARRYAEQAPEIPIGVFLGGVQARPAADGGQGTPGVPMYIETDRKADFYRAGRCAALFALSGEGEVLFFTGDSVNQDDKDAFLTGLRDQGFENPPLFAGRGEPYTPKGLSCVVMARAEEAYLDSNPDVPTILFSWLDPGMSPREIKLIFDDSPWGQVAAAAGMIHQGGELQPVASEVLALNNRIEDAVLRQEIKKARRSNFSIKE
jgi:hypothetical protein